MKFFSNLFIFRDVLAEPARRRFFRCLAGGLAILGSGRNVIANSKPVPPSPDPGVPVAGDYALALATALRGQTWRPSDAVRMEVPQLAENGAIVPVTVESLLPETRRILLFAEKNPGPLLAEFELEHGADAYVSLRLKLNESGQVLALVESDGQWYGATAFVRVMVGGCG